MSTNRKKRRGAFLNPLTPSFYFPAKKSLGQHFLKNPRVVERMLETAHLERGETVLEIGPGTGILTEGLLMAGARVVAIEADERAVLLLRKRYAKAIASGALTLSHADVRDVRVGEVISAGESYSIIANIPYYLSGILLRTALADTHQPRQVVFLVQNEVAERIARSHKESLLSLSVKAYGRPRYICAVSRGNFTPPPDVDGAILAIDRISRARFQTLDEAWFFAVLRAGFAARRKQLLGNLAALRAKEILLRHFTALGIPQRVRGEDLSIDTWCALAAALVQD
ncbi:MAG: 16S rRNA (adenine(1518)-N(6)/adenine(1519)-N(6))-dimethyltransferase RsmA [Patescibacteria group bacterium]|nr:16S rRNA (adenine(1518)-N(6)/adenine(1519)-N(6))-dimethyltransferase RsmA [Patescibacteria group bacterium]